MAKALKAFRHDINKLRPLYINKGITSDVHPNYTSILGVEQTFEPDPHDLNRVGFSTAILRNKDSFDMLDQIIEAIHSGGGGLYEVEVDDPKEVDIKHRDTEAEAVFGKIKPIKKLDVPGIHEPTVDEIHVKRKMLNAIDADKEREDNPNYYLTEQEYHKQEDEIATEYAKAEQAGNTKYMDYLLSRLERLDNDWSRQQRDKESDKKDKITGYKFLRSRGYTINDISEALKFLKFKQFPQKTDTYKRKQLANIYGMFIKDPDYTDKLQALIAELEADPDYISDSRVKNILNAIKRKY